MAFRGRKVADVYAELHLDRDSAQATLRGTSAALGPDADRAGQELGKKMTDGLARAVEASSARLAKARRAEVDAANAVKLAELRLNEARKKGLTEGSARSLALTTALEKAQYRLAQAQNNTTTSTKKFEDAQRLLANSMDDVGKKIGPNAQKAGDDAGGKLALGMRMSIIRNSPLIVAAIGGVLAAGAPVAMAGAVALFAGIGIVAAAQSEKVQSAWLGTWQRVKAGAIADASAIEPVLVRLADRVGDGFDRMRPRLRDAFSAAAPQIEVFTDGVLRLAENALPGLVRAVERGMPVTAGLADFLGKTGTGLSDFFDRISDHGPAAGQVFSSLGDTMATLLPLLGELLGQGAELAADVLPMLNSSLGLVLNVVELLGPALPAIATGFAAMKIANSVAGGIGSLATRLDTVAKGGGMFAGIAGRVSGGLSGIAGAAGPAAAGIAFVAVGLEKWNELGEKTAEMNLRLGQAVHVGGSQAEAASKHFDLGDRISGWIPDAIEGFSLLGHSVGDMIPTAENADAEYKKWVESLGASAQAAAEVKLRTEDLDHALKNHGQGSAEAKRAAGELTVALAEQARVNADLERSTRGVTEAMVDQANQARSRVDASFAYEQSLNAIEDAQKNLTDAQKHLNDSNKDTRTTTEDVERAQLALNQAYDQSVESAGRIATSGLPASMDEQQKAIIGAKAELDELNKLIAQGVELPPSMEAYRQQLLAITGQADGAMLAQAQLAAAVGELGFAVEAVPGEKTVTITAPTDELRARLGELGFTIKELPNGDIEVVADTQAARDRLGTLSADLVGLNNTTATPTVAADDTGFSAVYGSVMQRAKELADQRPTPVAGLDASGFSVDWSRVIGNLNILNGQRPSPVATLYANTGGAESALNVAARNRVSYVTQYVTIASSLKYGKGTMAIGGKVGDAVRGFAGGGSPSRRFDGRISGPGGPLDDMVPAITNMGEPIRVANTEWVINGMVSGRQGDAKMSALNAGRADIVVREPARRFADGGTPNPITGTGTGQMNGFGIKVENLNVTFSGAGLTTDRQSMRQAALMLREELIKLERAEH